MAKVRDVLNALETIAPPRFAASWDKIGLQVGDPNAAVTRAVVSLDRSLAAVETCRERGAELLVSHHPLIFQPLQTLDARRYDARTILALAQGGIAFIAAHTNWDAAQGGVNDALAARLGLQMVQEFGMASEVSRFKLVFFVPAEGVEAAIDAAIDAATLAGAEMIGDSHLRAFRVDGHGSYFEGESTAHLRTGELVRIEMVVRAGRESGVIRSVAPMFPTFEKAHELIPLHPVREQPMGRMGRVDAITLADFLKFVDERLGTRSLAWGDPEKKIRTVGVFGGAADSEWIAAQRASVNVLITGEVKQHVALEAAESGMCILASGHYATEQPGVEALRDRLAEAIPEVEWILFTPDAGRAGRPFYNG
jgi:dinuclear metal center YbgI/SA1388 family protein